MSRYLVIIIFLIYPFSFINAQINIDRARNDSVNKKWLVTEFIKDDARLWTSPIRYKKNDFKIAIPVICASALAIVYDEKIYSNFHEFVGRNKGLKDAGSYVTLGGGSIFPYALIGVFYFGGIAFKDERAKQTGFLALYALAQTGVFINIAKLTAGRQRPFVQNGEDKWNWLSDFKIKKNNKRYRLVGLDSYHNSFPSGHSSVAWALASVIATQYNDKKIVAPVVYTLATAVSLSRLTENKHWASDVIIGSAIGYGVGKFVANHHKNTKWTLFPSVYKNNVILAANLKL